MNNFEVLNIFPIPLIKFKFKYHKNYNFNNIEKSIRLPDGWTVPLNSSFPNIKDDDNLVKPKTRDFLMSDIQFCINEVFEELNLPTNYTFKDFWYNIYHKEQGQESHHHLSYVSDYGVYWSGVYYNKNSSPTEFTRPDRLYQSQLFPGYKDCGIKESYYYTFNPNVEDGDILLFPPYLYHCVPEVQLKEPEMRMTFSFNLQLNNDKHI